MTPTNDLARALQKSEEPIMLRRAGASWQTGTLAALLEKHGSDIIKVVTSGGVYRGEAKVEVRARRRTLGGWLWLQGMSLRVRWRLFCSTLRVPDDSPEV